MFPFLPQITLGVPRGKLAPKAAASYSVLLAPGGCHVGLPSGIAMHLRVWSWALIYGRMGEKANLPFILHCATCEAWAP